MIIHSQISNTKYFDCFGKFDIILYIDKIINKKQLVVWVWQV